MKKLLFIALLAISACNTVDKKESLPIEVMNLKEVKKYDTILTIETNIQVHQFDKNETYIGSYPKSSDGVPMFVVGICVGIILCLIIYSLTF